MRLPVAFVLSSVVAATPLVGQVGAHAPLDHEAIARQVIAALALQPGERVLLVGHPQFARELIRPMRLEIVRQGGVDLGFMEVLSDPRSGDDASRRAARAALRVLMNDVDAAVMMPGSSSDHPEYQAMQDVLQSGRGRTIHLHWDANGSIGLLPGHPAPPLYQVDLAYQRALLETDLAALRRSQDRFIAAMRGGLVRVTSPAGTDVRFRIGDRPVNRQDGDASAARAARGRILIDREIELPAGAIRVAPLEESVSGTVVFPISSWSNRDVRDLRLVFREGRVVELTAASGADAVRAELAAGGDGASRFREFALGMNPLLAVPDRQPWIPYYGYGAGVVRLSLGDNSELGGRVGGGYVRWNFFVDTSVWIDGEQWVRDGRLIR
ncbi:MAG: aminopeptidase [Gemmatimonadales bacterium]